MRAEERRQAIRELLQRAKQPVSATALAAQFSVMWKWTAGRGLSRAVR